MNQILQGQPMTISATAQSALSYIGDIAPIIADADVPAARNQVFNVGADQAWSVKDPRWRWRGRWAPSCGSRTWRRGSRCRTPTRRTTRWRGSSASGR